jgi:hypothetical protein
VNGSDDDITIGALPTFEVGSPPDKLVQFNPPFVVFLTAPIPVDEEFVRYKVLLSTWSITSAFIFVSEKEVVQFNPALVDLKTPEFPAA